MDIITVIQISARTNIVLTAASFAGTPVGERGARALFQQLVEESGATPEALAKAVREERHDSPEVRVYLARTTHSYIDDDGKAVIENWMFYSEADLPRPATCVRDPGTGVVILSDTAGRTRKYSPDNIGAGDELSIWSYDDHTLLLGIRRHIPYVALHVLKDDGDELILELANFIQGPGNVARVLGPLGLDQPEARIAWLLYADLQGGSHVGQ